MEQRKSNKEEKLRTVQEAAEEFCKTKPVTLFADEEMPLEDDLKSTNCEFSVAKYTDSRRPNLKQIFSKKKMSYLSFHQMVPKIECALETQGHIAASQEVSCNSIELNKKEDAQEPWRKERQVGQIDSGDELAVFEVVPTSKVSTDSSQTQNEPVVSILAEFKIKQTVIKCLQEMTDQVVYEFEFGDESLSSSRNTRRTFSQGMDAQSNVENSSSSSYQEIVKIQPGKKPGVGYAAKNSLLINQRMKKVRKDFDILSSMLTEIERMNDYHKQDIFDKNKEMRALHAATKHVNETLDVIEGLSSFSIAVNKTGEANRVLNVFKHGSDLFVDLVILLKSMHTFLKEYNEYRLKFHELCEMFSSLPLETNIGVNGGIDEIVKTSINIYNGFFSAEKFDDEYEMLNLQHQIYKSYINQFNEYIDKLVDQVV